MRQRRESVRGRRSDRRGKGADFSAFEHWQSGTSFRCLPILGEYVRAGIPSLPTIAPAFDPSSSMAQMLRVTGLLAKT